jgi:hypothetical protein
MTPTRAGDDEPELLALSLEERLRHVRECCRLLGDFFAIQAEATFLACEATSSSAWCRKCPLRWPTGTVAFRISDTDHDTDGTARPW